MTKPIEFDRATLAALNGVDITQPSQFRPGSPEKMLLMQLRHLKGLPFHVEGDRSDAQPRDRGERKYTCMDRDRRGNVIEDFES